jgi:hypothetical protein
MGFFTGLSWLVGAGLLTVQTGRLSMWMWKEFIRAPTILTNRYGYGSWALINGKPGYYATELAGHKFNLIFLSDDPKDVEAEAKALEAQFGIQTQVVKVNQASPVPEDYKKVIDKLKDRDISILVNNAMKGTTDDLVNQPFDDIKMTLSTCMFPTLYVSYYMLPRMMAREKRGAIVNHGGQDSGYHDFLSRSLGLEYEHKVDFMSVVDTKNDPTVAKKALENLGTFSQTFSDYQEEWKSLFKLNNILRLLPKK